jgi:hypothetical protein
LYHAREQEGDEIQRIQAFDMKKIAEV